MNAGTPRQEPRPPRFVWWVIWAALLAGFLQVRWYLGPVRTALRGPAAGLVGAGFLFVSVAVRWLLLPRIARAGVAFIFFLIGQALAESCGYFGLFLGGTHRDFLVAGGILGLVQFMPRFARRYYAAAPAGR